MQIKGLLQHDTSKKKMAFFLNISTTMLQLGKRIKLLRTRRLDFHGRHKFTSLHIKKFEPLVKFNGPKKTFTKKKDLKTYRMIV